MNIVVQIIILLIVLACMVMVLLAIRKLFNYEEFDDEEETTFLRDEVEDDIHVVSHNSIFHTIVDTEDSGKHRAYKENSKEPLSPKE